MITVNIHEAKAHFSELVRKVEQGETVQVCRRNEPILEMVFIPKKPKKKRVLGLHDGWFKVSDDAFAPMSEEELSLWYDSPIFPDEAEQKKP